MNEKNEEQSKPKKAKPKKAKSKSRARRWADAAAKASMAIGDLVATCDGLETTLEDLKLLQEEYSEWKEIMPANFAGSPLAEKLEAVCSIDLESIMDSVRTAIDEAESTILEAEEIDLPQDFGKD